MSYAEVSMCLRNMFTRFHGAEFPKAKKCKYFALLIFGVAEEREREMIAVTALNPLDDSTLSDITNL